MELWMALMELGCRQRKEEERKKEEVRREVNGWPRSVRDRREREDGGEWASRVSGLGRKRKG